MISDATCFTVALVISRIFFGDSLFYLDTARQVPGISIVRTRLRVFASALAPRRLILSLRLSPVVSCSFFALRKYRPETVRKLVPPYALPVQAGMDHDYRYEETDQRQSNCPTQEMLGDFFTKPLQGSAFWKDRNLIMNLPEDMPLPITTTGPQDSVLEHQARVGLTSQGGVRYRQTDCKCHEDSPRRGVLSQESSIEPCSGLFVPRHQNTPFEP